MTVTLQGAVAKGHRPLILRPMERADRRALLVLVILPVLFFVIPTLAGHPPLAGDNLIQNFPLRVLTGQQLRAGFLPLWNPLAFSGSALLGALNSGSYFPGTWLFIFLPAMVAWVLNMIGCYVVAGIGLYLLCRWLGLRSLASLLGALSYAFTGTMIGQMVHLGVIQGQALLPWVVLAILVLSERLRANGSSPSWRADLIRCGWPFVALVLVVALIVLTGEPRAIADLVVVGVLCGLYVLVVPTSRAGLSRRALLAVVAAVAVGWGIALCGAELLVSQHVISASQRSDLTSSFIGSGSLNPRWTALLGIPDLSGGNGLFGQPSWFVQYNLPEVTSYSGLLALAGLFAAIGQLIGRRRTSAPRWLWLFVSMVVVGLILSWGEYTPLFHVIAHLPIIDRTRLQSRSMAIVCLALCVLLAFFLDRVLEADLDGASLLGWRRWLTAAPILATALIALVALGWPAQLESWMEATGSSIYQGRRLWPSFLIVLVLCALTLLVVLGARSLGSERRRRLVIAVVVLDVAFFLVTSTTGLTGGGAPSEPSRAQATALLGTQGRFALVDQSLATYNQFVGLGLPNTNVFTGLASIQGYGSLVNNTYNTATNTHLLGSLDACQLELGRFRQLQLASLGIGANQLAPVIATKGPGAQVLPLAPVPGCPGARPVAHGGLRRFVFGQSIEVASVFVAARSAAVMRDEAAVASLHLSVLGADGSIRPVASTITALSTGWLVRLEHPTPAAGLALSGPVHQIMDASEVTGADGTIYSLDGAFQDAVDDGAWDLTATTGTYQVFHAASPLVPALSLRGGRASSTVRSRQVAANGDESDVIDARSPITVVRAVAYARGWRATFTPVGGGASTTVPLAAHDLVQSFRLPAGLWRVDIAYRPSGLVHGLLLSGLSAGVLAVLAVLLVVRDRRRRRERAR
jgi:hypothetical protein